MAFLSMLRAGSHPGTAADRTSAMRKAVRIRLIAPSPWSERT